MTKDTEALREALEQVKQLAQRDMARPQTDFLGRMGQELCDFEAAIEPYPDGELPDDVRGDAYDAISGLAGLAFAQMLMLRGCDHTIFATPASDVAPVDTDDRMVAVASRNLKTFIKAAQFKCGADRDAALACVEVLDDRISGLGDLVAVLRSAFAASQSLANPPAHPVDPAGGEALREALRRARDYLLEVGNDYPGSSCQKWCAEKATEIWNTLKPWEHCPSTHCERAQQCRSPNECSANTAALKGPAA